LEAGARSAVGEDRRGGFWRAPFAAISGMLNAPI
jgi:hypothetical protein